MLDFYKIKTAVSENKRTGRMTVKIYPVFVVKTNSCDLMTKGGDFYAVWDDENKMWSQDEQTVIDLIDSDISKKTEEVQKKYKDSDRIIVEPLYMEDSHSGSIDSWHKYVQKQLRANYHNLDESIIFLSDKTTRLDYASKRLDYDMAPGDISAYDELMSTLYTPKERDKLEWAIGAIISGDSKHIQKFIVLYGDPGSGKSTFLNIVEMLFKPYMSTFDAKAIGSGTNAFALETFRDNPLVSIQHDGDLSRIEDNTKINSIVSHEELVVNEKFRAQYVTKFNTFLFMGTNRPVKISEAKSGITRRLIDVYPSGEKLSYKRYRQIMKTIPTELGAIAQYCLDRYEELGETYYDSYIPIEMIGATNDFYNFVMDKYDLYLEQDSTNLNETWKWYTAFCENYNVHRQMERKIVGLELKNYFREFKQEAVVNGKHIRNYYSGFMKEKFMTTDDDLVPVPNDKANPFTSDISLIDTLYADCPAQYASANGTPVQSWNNVTTTLKDIDTSKLHYVLIPKNHIVIDFDIKDKNGNKSFESNLKAAMKWPETYMELSKSGGGIHLHYIYDGDPTKLSSVYDDDIEIKVFTGKMSLRRQLTKCNNKQVAVIRDGLPLKGEKSMINFEGLKNEKALRTQIEKCLRKEHHGHTKPEVDFIFKTLNDAYANKDLHYDVSDLRPRVLAFAANSTHNADFCVNLVSKMRFTSEEPGAPADYESDELVFFDVEVFPNLFVVVWKKRGGAAVKMINPSPQDMLDLMKLKLVGFNCRRYDNHIIYARSVGYSLIQLFELSQRIINGSKNAMFREAYNVSYTDVYDFCATKMSLKKWEIKLGIKHQELGLKWDEPVPEELWNKVAEYCVNDVVATEAVFDENQGDFTARKILADITGLTVNDTTNTLTTKLIFGDEKHPVLNYVDLSKEFPGYEYVNGKNMYKGEDVGKGGYVYAEEGLYYGNIVTFDSASHHPHSIKAMNLFGEHTQNYVDLMNTRIFIKHKDYESAKKLFGGKLAPYLKDESMAKSLSKALKIAINSVYGLTSAAFDNPFRDPRNVNNVVALRGALFMVDLRDEVQKRGFKVIHIKTDSIKILNPTEELSKFINEFAEKYGYEFEIEHKFTKMCLVNDAVFIAKLSDDDPENPGKWMATGAEFAQPYVYKKLFSHEPIEFKDMCETKSVTSSLYLDMNENLPEGEHNYQFIGKVGLFCPIKPGCGGGLLLREKDGKYYSATGAKGYRWLEATTVSELGKVNDIDHTYYQKLVDSALADINKFGDPEIFRSDTIVVEPPMTPVEPSHLDIESDELPF